MRSKLFLSLLALLFTAAAAQAQTYSLQGSVRDANDQQALIGVSVVVSPAADTSIRSGAVTDMDGNFMIANLAAGSYVLRISYLGYEPVTRSVNLLADQDLGVLQMKTGNNVLQTVTVEGTQIRSQQLGDTSQFNAGSFKTNPDANAEDLITKMPGVTSDNGTVKVNGEDVKQVLVDGKPFFGDDPNAALKNLPSEIIDKIQVFDQQSDQSQFTGFDDGNTKKTINIVTKRGRNNGVFGRLQAGYGTDDRYTAGGNLNFFNGDRRISIVGLANNVNQQNFSSEDLLGISDGGGGRGGFGGSGGGRGGRGGGRGGSSDGGGNFGGGGGGSSNFLVGQQNGITQTQSGGINYSDTWSKKLKVTGSYFFNRSENTNTTTLTRSYFATDPDSALGYNETGTSRSINYNHRANLRLEWNIDSNNSLLIVPRVSFQNNESDRNILGLSTIGANGLDGRVQNRYTSNNSGYSLGNQLLYRHRFAKPGRTISVGINTTYNEKTGDGSLYSLNEYYGSDTTLTDQRYDLSSDGINLSGNLTYTEPLSRKSQLMVTYNPSYNRSNSDKETFNNTQDGYTDLDTSLTNTYENTYTTQRGGLGYRYNDSQYNFMVSLNAQQAVLDGDQSFPYPLQVNKTFTNLLPSAMFNYRFSRTQNLRLMYRTNTNPPSITQLQNVVDNSNPLLLRTGNPDLKQDYTHTLSLRYGNTNSKKGTGLFIFASASMVNDYVANNTVIATNDTVVRGVALNRGSQLSFPVNIDGNWSARSFLTYSLPISPIKSNLNLSGGYTFNRTPGLINNLTNYANTHAINGGVVLSSNISENIDFTLSYQGAYNIVNNTLQAQSDYNYYSQNTSLKLNWIFLDRFVANTNFNHTLYSGLGEGYDRNFLLWNASLGYKFLKDKSLQADIYAFDLLDQNNSISRTITDAYVEDAQTQVLQRYVMLRLTYTLRQFKGTAAANSDRPNDGFGPRRGDRPERGGGF